MKKRILSFILTAVMLVGMIVLPAAAASTPFKDVKDGKWYTEAIKYVYDNKLMNGMTDTTFEPDTPMNRAMLVTVLYRSEGEPATSGKTPFTDLKANWYKKSVAWAYENKVVNGTTDTTFSPTTPITREQIATIFYRFAQFKGRDTSAKANLNTFPDGSKVAKYAKDAMTWAVGEGLITGTKAGKETLLDPKGNATRAQVATILMRYLESEPKSLQDKIDAMLDRYLCVTHGDINIQFGYTGATVTEENMANILKKIARLDDRCTVTFDDFDVDVKEEYQLYGDGQYVPIGELDVTFADPETEETVTESIKFSIRKVLPSGDAGFPNGALGICPEDRNPEFVAAEKKFGGAEPRETSTTYAYDGKFTEADIEAFFRDMTGLTDAKTYPFFITEADMTQIEAGEPFYACFVDKNAPDGRADLIWVRAILQPTLESKVMNGLDRYLCVTHDKLDLVFNFAGGSFTEENLCNILRQIAGVGEEVTVEIDNFEDLSAEYGSAGDDAGGYGAFWPDESTLTFTDTVTGETVETTVAFAFRKCLSSSEIYPNGVIGTCKEDADQGLLDAQLKMHKIAFTNGDQVYDGYTGEYNAEAIEAFFRELSGLTDTEKYEFRLIGFDPSDPTHNFNVLFINTKADDGRFDAIWDEFKFAE